MLFRDFSLFAAALGLREGVAGEGVDEAAVGGVVDAGAYGIGIAADAVVGAEGNVEAQHHVVQADVAV